MTRKVQDTASEDKAKSKYRRVMPTRIVYTGKPPELEEPDDLELDDTNRPRFEAILDELWNWETCINELKRGNKYPFFQMIFKSGNNRPKEVDDLLIKMARSSTLFSNSSESNFSPRLFRAQQELYQMRKGSHMNRYELIRDVGKKHHISEGHISNTESKFRAIFAEDEAKLQAAFNAAKVKKDNQA